jgi:hypothetical protein
VTLTDAELAALPVAIGARPLTMSVWGLAAGRGSVGKTARDHQAVTRQAQEIASRAHRAFDADQRPAGWRVTPLRSPDSQ